VDSIQPVPLVTYAVTDPNRNLWRTELCGLVTSCIARTPSGWRCTRITCSDSRQPGGIVSSLRPQRASRQLGPNLDSTTDFLTLANPDSTAPTPGEVSSIRLHESNNNAVGQARFGFCPVLPRRRNHTVYGPQSGLAVNFAEMGLTFCSPSNNQYNGSSVTSTFPSQILSSSRRDHPNSAIRNRLSAAQIQCFACT